MSHCTVLYMFIVFHFDNIGTGHNCCNQSKLALLTVPGRPTVLNATLLHLISLES